MNDIIMWCIIGVVGALILVALICFIVKLCKMKPEERKKLLLTFLEGVVTMAEREIGAGHGDEKLKMVEDYFNAHASWFMKILLALTKTDNLKDLIEEALKRAKSTFDKKDKAEQI